jgi:hypothetical protein
MYSRTISDRPRNQQSVSFIFQTGMRISESADWIGPTTTGPDGFLLMGKEKKKELLADP